MILLVTKDRDIYYCCADDKTIRVWIATTGEETEKDF